MSRVGKMPVAIPAGVDVSIKDDQINVKGTGGTLALTRNALVNVNHVRKMSALSSQRWLLTLNNNQEFIVSKRQASSVRQLLSW